MDVTRVEPIVVPDSEQHVLDVILSSEQRGGAEPNSVLLGEL